MWLHDHYARDSHGRRRCASQVAAKQMRKGHAAAVVGEPFPTHGEKRMPIITPKQRASKFKSGQRILIETEDKITWTTINKVEDEIAHIDGVEVAATEIRAEARNGTFVWVWRP
jgi:hypothetical protein